MKKKILIVLIVFNIIYLILYYFNISYYEDNDIPIINITLNDISIDNINSNSKDIKYSNNKLMVIEKNKYYFDDVTIKGRGNYTWTLEKKPYQITFNEKESILGLPKGKKYILLANYTDGSLLKNDFSYSIAKSMNLNHSFTGVFVDLYVDRNYIGNYYLTPKVSSIVEDNTKDSILVELDNLYYKDEEIFFESDIFNDNLVLKESNSSDDSFDVFIDKYNNMEKAIVDRDYDWLCSIVDIDSFAKYYIISEFSGNFDSIKSSLFFYMDGNNDKIHIGPLWDFDLGYDTNKLFPIKNNTICNDDKCSSLFYNLLQIPEFNDLVKKTWNDLGSSVYKDEIKDLERKIKYLKKAGNYNNNYWEKRSFDSSTNELLKWIKDRYEIFNKYMGE